MPEQIAEFQEKDVVQYDFDDLRISVSKDERRGWITLLREVGGPEEKSGRYTLEELQHALTKSQIVFGIDNEKLAAIAAGTNNMETELIAEYLPPAKGAPAQLKYLVNPEYSVAVREDGSANFKDVGYIVDIRRGQILMRKIPPEPGKTGSTITGTEIPPIPGDDINLNEYKGENTEIRVAKQEIVAKIDGFFDRDSRGRVHIRDHLFIDSDIDYKTGNIDSRYQLEIQGDVKPEFAVRGRKSVLIHGAVEDSQLRVEEDLTIERGIVQGTRTIVVGGHLESRYIYERYFVQADSIHVKEMVAFSNIWVVKTLEAMKLAGGTFIIGRTAALAELGNKENSRTVIRIGRNPVLLAKLTDYTVRLRELEPQVAMLTKSYEKLEKTALSLQEMLTVMSDQGREHQIQMQRIAERAKKNQSELEIVKQELDQKENLARSIQMEVTFLKMEVDYDSPRLEVKGRIFPGVVVYMGTMPPINFTKVNTGLTIELSDNGEIITNHPIIS